MAMYNRYIRNDNGAYTRIPEDDGRQTGSSPDPIRSGGRQDGPSESQRETHRQADRPGGGNAGYDWPPRSGRQEERQPFPFPRPEEGEGVRHTLRRLLDRFHLDHVDTGDLLLLVLIFFLLQEDTDEELLIALGLLLIL